MTVPDEGTRADLEFGTIPALLRAAAAAHGDHEAVVDHSCEPPVRLSYAEVEHRCIPDLAAALAGHPEPVDVIATYTPFQRLRKMGGV